MVNAKAKGTNFERECKEIIEYEEPDTMVFRSPASLGSADLIAITRCEIETDSNNRIIIASIVRLYQAKYLEKYMSKKEKERLISDADKLGAGAILTFREKPRGKIRFKDLKTNYSWNPKPVPRSRPELARS